MRHPLKIAAGLVTAVVGLTALAGCGGPAAGDAAGGSGGRGSLSLVAYSTPKEAYAELIPAFNKTPAGKGVKFTQSYGASGDQSRAVAAGLPADIVALSLAPDIDKLVDPGIVDANWAKNSAHNGFVTNSVVVLAVRKGNPKHIKGWDDLIKPGVQVDTPNPFTSGGAKWNLMAAYGAQIAQGKSPTDALAYLKALLKNTPVQDKSARESLATFAGGKGDVLISYENEAITAQKSGVDLDYVIPYQTILIQNPAAVTKDSKSPTQAKAFLDFLGTTEAQKIFAAKGYRSVIPSLVDKSKYPTPKQLFDITKFGGWSKVNAQFFDPDKGAVAKIEQDLGVSTAK
ncbi:MAG: sulfate/thiosulfate transport system substrate-binding protein [Solirubrobacteraceae bacterium]|nr:sulfate/thiosulfate transport system substrate-binding protein [Solirubrobacteraceae bacterium]